MPESKGAYTIRDLQEHNKNAKGEPCSRSWILRCIELQRLPQPDERIGKDGKYMLWRKLHTIAQK